MTSPWMLHCLLFNKMSRSTSLFVAGGQATVERAGEARAAVMAGAAGAAMVEVEDSVVAAAMVEVEDSVVAAAMVEVEDSVVAALVAARVKWYISTAISTAVLVPGDSATVVRASESSDCVGGRNRSASFRESSAASHIAIASALASATSAGPAACMPPRGLIAIGRSTVSHGGGGDVCGGDGGARWIAVVCVVRIAKVPAIAKVAETTSTAYPPGGAGGGEGGGGEGGGQGSGEGGIHGV